MTLLSVRVYYIVCDATVINFSAFPTTPTGRDVASVVTATGTCVANSSADVTHQSALCKADGSWFMVTDGCVCEAGYQPTSHNKSCSGICQLANIYQKIKRGLRKERYPQNCLPQMSLLTITDCLQLNTNS